MLFNNLLSCFCLSFIKKKSLKRFFLYIFFILYFKLNSKHVILFIVIFLCALFFLISLLIFSCGRIKKEEIYIYIYINTVRVIYTSYIYDYKIKGKTILKQLYHKCCVHISNINNAFVVGRNKATIKKNLFSS